MTWDRRTVLGSIAASLLSLPRVGVAAGRDDAPPVVLEARAGSLRLVPPPAAETPVWGYNGSVPGPVLRVKKGERLAVRLVNRLDQPTTLCWHGVRGPNATDGVGGLTQKPVAPGESFDYSFTPPDSGVFWYHPHVWPHSAEQQGRGLYGVLVVEEAEPPAVDDDLLVVLDDWSLDDKGAVRGDFGKAEEVRGAGRVGALVTVDATPAPLRKTVRPGARLRLRLVNACAARIAVVAFDDAKPMVQAIDGQPCELFQPVRNTIPLGPGARFDITLDAPDGAGRDARLMLREDGGAGRPLLVIATAGEAVRPHPPVAALPANVALPSAIHLERALKMDLVIAAAAPTADPRQAWTINGVASDGFSGKPLFSVKRGSPVSLTLVNKGAVAQHIHLQGHVFRLLHDLDDGWEPYWRDAVLVAEGRTKHIAFVADNPGKWALESAILDHQTGGLAAWFEVT